MSLIETLGFIISLIAFVILSFRRQKERRQGRDYSRDEPADDEHTQREQLKAFLRSIDVQMEEDEKPAPQRRPPPPPPKKQIKQQKVPAKSMAQNYRFESRLEEKPRSAVEERKLQTKLDKQTVVEVKHVKASELMKRVSSKKDLFIINEIMTPYKYDRF